MRKLLTHIRMLFPKSAVTCPKCGYSGMTLDTRCFNCGYDFIEKK